MVSPGDDLAVKIDPAAAFLKLGPAVGVMLAFASGAVWINANFQDLSFSNKQLTQSINQLEHRIDGMQDRWTTRDMAQWVELLKAKNSTLLIPDVPR
jgi:hypothetical protein